MNTLKFISDEKTTPILKIKSNKLATMIQIIVENNSNFPLINYDKLATMIYNEYINIVNNIKLKFNISHMPVDTELLIREFWTQVDIWHILPEFLNKYYLSILSNEQISLNQIIMIDIDNKQYNFYDINFFISSSEELNHISLSNINLYFILYKHTANYALKCALKRRYIEPLIIIINQMIVQNI